jgi:phage terminase large subunit
MLLDLKTKYVPLFENDTRYFVVTGGRGSGKSFSINVFLLLLTYELNQTILFTRYTLTSAEVSIIPEFIEKIELLDRQNDFEITKREIVNKTTGSKILFKGIKTGSGNQTANLKSLAGVTCWVLDEAEELTDENVFDKIDFSIRLKGIQNRVILVLNPTTKEHFIYNRFFESVGVDAGTNGTKNDTTYIHTTYLDNIENLDSSFINQVERLKKTNESKYKHTILGGWLDKAEGVVYTNWRIGAFETHSTPIYGQDYGYSIDPTTLVKTSIDFKNKRIYVEELFCRPNLTTTEIANLNKQLTNGGLIYGDSAESRLIAELQMAGNNILPVKKTEVTYGISVLQDYELIISENSTNLIKELNNYHWLDNKKATPCDMHNHLLDSLRYATVGQIVTKESKYFIY